MRPARRAVRSSGPADIRRTATSISRAPARCLVELGELSTQPSGLGLGPAHRGPGVGDVTSQVLVGPLERPDEAA